MYDIAIRCPANHVQHRLTAYPCTTFPFFSRYAVREKSSESRSPRMVTSGLRSVCVCVCVCVCVALVPRLCSRPPLDPLEFPSDDASSPAQFPRDSFMDRASLTCCQLDPKMPPTCSARGDDFHPSRSTAARISDRLPRDFSHPDPTDSPPSYAQYGY